MFLSACSLFGGDGDESADNDVVRPDSYVKPMPVEKVEEEVIRPSS